MTETSNPFPGYAPFRYYSGPMHGWITFWRSDADGTCWWLNNNQWRWWDNASRRWVFTGVRTRDVHTNIWVGAALGFLVLLFGIAIGGPAAPGCAVFAVFCLLLGMGNSRLQNRHPEAYQAVVLASAVAGAYSTYELAHKANRLLHE